MSKKRKLDCIIENFASTLVLEENPDIYKKLDENSNNIEMIIKNQEKILDMLQKFFPIENIKDIELGNEYNYLA